MKSRRQWAMMLITLIIVMAVGLAAVSWLTHTMQRDFNRKYFPAGVPTSR